MNGRMGIDSTYVDGQMKVRAYEYCMHWKVELGGIYDVILTIQHLTYVKKNKAIEKIAKLTAVPSSALGYNSQVQQQ